MSVPLPAWTLPLPSQGRNIITGPQETLKEFMPKVWSDAASGPTDAAASPRRSWRSPAELSLDDRERFYLALVEQARDLITAIDEHGVILFKNRSTDDSLGYTPSELIGRNVFEFIHPDDLTAVRAAFAAGMRGEPGTPVEHRFRYKDGSWRVGGRRGAPRRRAR